MPVTGLPDWPTIGIASRIRIALPSVLILTIVGSNSGTQKVRRFFPSTAICPLGPRSVNIQNSSRGPFGSCHRSLPTEPKRTLRSLVTEPGNFLILKLLDRYFGECVGCDHFIL